MTAISFVEDLRAQTVAGGRQEDCAMSLNASPLFQGEGVAIEVNIRRVGVVQAKVPAIPVVGQQDNTIHPVQ